MSRRLAIDPIAGLAIPSDLHQSLRRWIAWGVWALAPVQVLAALLLVWANDIGVVTVFGEFVPSQALATLSYATIGLCIVLRHPANRIGWLFCASGLALGFTTWLGQYARYTNITDPNSLPATDILTWLAFWTFIPTIAAAVIVLALLFPTGHLPSAKWRPALWLVVAATLVSSISVALMSGEVDDTLPGISNPFGWKAAEPVLRALTPLMIVLIIMSLLVAVAAPVARYRRAEEDERRQLLWFAVAAAVVCLAHVLPAVLNPDGFTEDTLPSGILLALAYPCLPLAVGVAILRHRLWEMDTLLNRTLVYGALSVAIGAVYVVSVGILATVLRTGNLVVSLIVTGLVAVLFQPVRDRLQRTVNRMMYGDRDDPYAVLARLGRRLEASLTPDAVLPSIVESIQQALRLPYAAISLRDGDVLAPAATAGSPVPGTTRLPLTYGRETVGELVIAPRSPDEEFTRSDRQLIEDLARQIGVAVHAAILHSDLQRSRERLVMAREEERRRMRRDLHDGLGPALAAMTLQADEARDRIDDDPARAAELLAHLTVQLQAATADIRRLVYDLRPPALDDLGLVEGLRTFATRFAQPGREIVIEAPDVLPPLPAAVEVAAWRLVQEGLTNVVRHAAATKCIVRLQVDGSDLIVEIEDDGIGIQDEYVAGIGHSSMRERAAELGGRLAVERAGDRGTVIRAMLPISEHRMISVGTA